jgi:uncharacterized protein YecE (DUF72 family)
MLAEYAARLPTVEANSTFRELPSPDDVARWVAEVPRDFVFALKAPQIITHMRRLRGVEDDVAALLETQSRLKRNRGPLFFQLPSNFKCDLERLDQLLALVPPRAHAAVELRHPSWLERLDDALRILRRHKAALAIVDDDESTTPFIPTARFGYLRLRRARYTRAALAEWLARIRAAPWREAYVYFRHEERATGPRFARQLLALAAATR